MTINLGCILCTALWGVILTNVSYFLLHNLRPKEMYNCCMNQIFDGPACLSAC